MKIILHTSDADAAEMTARKLDDLIFKYEKKSARPVSHHFTQYSKDLATETLTALKELKQLRAGIKVEGTVD